MTTILADARLGIIVTDSSISDGDRVWSGRKVFRYKDVLYAFAGNIDEAVQFREWLKGGKLPRFSNSDCLALSAVGLAAYSKSTTPVMVEHGFEAIGSGAKAAMTAYEAMGFTDPRKAVRIVCKHDAGSRLPLRIYKLNP